MNEHTMDNDQPNSNATISARMNEHNKQNDQASFDGGDENDTAVVGAADDVGALDTILARIGQFGRYQLVNYVLLCVPMVFNALFSISYVFTASAVVHRCNITQCDSLTSDYWEPWVNFTIPVKGGTPDQCSRYESISPTGLCVEEYFNRSVTEKCGKDFKFRDTEYTIANEFGFFCTEEWKLYAVGTVNNIGQFVGIPLGGVLADRYGRRTMLAIGGFLAGAMGIIRSLSVNYYMFMAFEFFDMALGSTLFPTAFLLAIELVGPRRRVAAATIITIFYALGEALLAILAQEFQNWRILLRVMYVPALLQIFYLWILPESVRWLFSQGRDLEAVEILRKAANCNRREIPKEELSQLVDANRKKLTTIDESQYPILKAIRLFAGRISNCSLCWFTHTLVALGLSLNSVNLGGSSKYRNFMLNGVIQVPALILPLLIMDRIGRRYSLCGSMIICAVCMIATVIVGKDHYGASLALFLIGKMAITCSFQILYFFTSEIFPTNVRNSLLSLCSMVGRVGSMLAPQVILLSTYWQDAPEIIFATFGLVSGTMTLLFPETTDKVLPTSIEEANSLGKKARSRLRKSFRNPCYGTISNDSDRHSLKDTRYSHRSLQRYSQSATEL